MAIIGIDLGASAIKLALSGEKDRSSNTFVNRAACVKKKASEEARPYRHAVHASRAADVIEKRFLDVQTRLEVCG